ncbi:Transketolase [Savitreella phatthalungensis]
MAFTEVDNKAINTIRTLAVDVVGKSNSGHPGAPMGMAPIAHVLFNRHMSFNPKNPKWVNRDRFVLSNGHGCALQYILLHLYGYPLSMDDLKNFRQVDSHTPGHPECADTEGIEVTTGPLGQGIANAVGIAMAEAHTAAVYNKDGFKLIDNYTYCFLGDGCMMEGIASEACSLAGHLQLGKLIAFYDDNHISIDGDTNCAFTEDVRARYRSYGWHVIDVPNADTDLDAMEKAIEDAKAVTDKPSLICLETTIGYGSLEQGTHGVHGNPLKADDAKQVKKKFGFDPEQTFVVPQEVSDMCAKKIEAGQKAEAEWNKKLDEYAQKFPEEAKDLQRRLSGKLPEGWEKALPTYSPEDKAVATRKLSETALSAIQAVVPELFGGSADLTGSNLTRWKEAVDFQPPATGLGTYEGRYVRYGVREHAMGAIMNGLASYGTVLPYGGTFLNFVSYAAGAVRLSALSHFRLVWVATHDSIGLGEDGPTHQPIETLAHFRATPNMLNWRPADGNEVSAAYYVALTTQTKPSLLALSRQNLPHLHGSTIGKAAKGGYVLAEEDGAQITFVSTGSEVGICVDAAKELAKEGIKSRIVSMPCSEVFDSLSFDERVKVLPDGIPILSVEAYSTFGWERYSHEQFGINRFGASGPYQKLYEKFGLTPSNIAVKAKETIAFWKDVTPLRSPLRRAFYNAQNDDHRAPS